MAFSGLLYGTAEAAVALSCIAERLKSPSGLGIQLSVDAGPRDWIDSLGLLRMADSRWAQSHPVWNELFGCFVHPVQRLELKSKADASLHTMTVVNAIRFLPESILGDAQEAVLSSVERVVHETLVNIWEHAYTGSAPRTVFICATVTPSRHLEDDPDKGKLFTSSAELEWFAENREGRILEIAIADEGRGVPLTLWKSAKERQQEFTRHWRNTKLTLDQRARAHHALCEYAFHYDSTRKKPQDFDSLASRLSWRGLHRCLKQTEQLSGVIILASGQGRVGYAATQNRLAIIEPAIKLRADVPGTEVVLRFPTLRRASSPRRLFPGGNRIEARAGFIASEQDLRTGLAAEEITRDLVTQNDRGTGVLQGAKVSSPLKVAVAATPTVVVACFAFRPISRIDELVEVLHSLPPNHLAVLLFAEIHQGIRAELTAYSSLDSSSATDATPRLLCLWSPDQHSLVWQIAGEIPNPEFGLKVCARLEQLGHAGVGEETVGTIALARDLANTYPEWLSWNETTKTIGLTAPEIRLGTQDYARSLNMAFDNLWRVPEVSGSSLYPSRARRSGFRPGVS